MRSRRQKTIADLDTNFILNSRIVSTLDFLYTNIKMVNIFKFVKNFFLGFLIEHILAERP